MMQPIETVKVFQNHPAQSFKKGEAIFETGQTGNVMYGIVEGEVEMLVNGQVVETIHAGEIFGVGALVHDNEIRTSTAIAKTNCQIISLNRERFLFAVQETPLFALEVIRSYSDRFRSIKAML